MAKPKVIGATVKYNSCKNTDFQAVIHLDNGKKRIGPKCDDRGRAVKDIQHFIKHGSFPTMKTEVAEVRVCAECGQELPGEAQ